MSDPMTHPLAALLKDVPRFYNTSDTLMSEDPMGAYVHWHDLLAALEAAPPMGVKVKPLVWEDRGGAVHPQFKAVTGFGTYYIERNKGGLFDWWTPALRGKVEVKTLDAAKAAAQADYEARILASVHHVNETPKSEHDAGNVLTVPDLVEAAGKLTPELRKLAWSFGGETADLIDDLIALATAQAAQIAGLQRTYEELYADALADAKSDAQDFDSDLWIEVRKYLTELHLDWGDYAEDGILAEQAIEHIRECMNEETRRADAAEAEAHACGAERERWKDRAEAAEAKVAELTKERDAGLQREADANAAAFRHKAEVERLRGALAFYADEGTYETQYERLPCDCCTDIYEPINRDKGAIARAAITEAGK